MFVAFCDQVDGNSTSSCLKPPTSAVRSCQSTVSNGSVPGLVNRRSIVNPPSRTPARVVREDFSVACCVGGIPGSPYGSLQPLTGCTGVGDIRGRVGRKNVPGTRPARRLAILAAEWRADQRITPQNRENRE